MKIKHILLSFIFITLIFNSCSSKNKEDDIPQKKDEVLDEEVEVLFSGSKQLTLFNIGGINNAYSPWDSKKLPPDDKKWSTYTWHGGWGYEGTSSNTIWVLLPHISNNFLWMRGSSGTMLEFMVKNRDSEGPWTNEDYYFTDLDTWASYLRGQGKKGIINVHCHIWNTATSYGNYTFTPLSAKRYVDAVQRVVNRVGDILLAVETANEPPAFGTSNTSNWNNSWSGTKEQWAQQSRLIKQAVIHSNYPGILVVGPNLCSTAEVNWQGIENMFTASAYGADGGYGDGSGTSGKDWIDVVGIHGYQYPPLPRLCSDQTYQVERLSSLKTRLASLNITKPVWITEWMGQSGNWNSNDHNTPPASSPADRLGYTGGESDKWQWFEATAIAMALGIERIVHFSWLGSIYTDTSLETVVARRKWRNQMVDWLTASPITRVALTKSGKIRVTRSDGAVMETNKKFD
jgi:hypothetical protein